MTKKGTIYKPVDLSEFDAEIQRINDEIDRLNTERDNAHQRRGNVIEGAFESLPEVPGAHGTNYTAAIVSVRLVRYAKASVWVSMSASEHALNNPKRCSRANGNEVRRSRYGNRLRLTDLDALEAAIAAHERGEK